MDLQYDICDSCKVLLTSRPSYRLFKGRRITRAANRNTLSKDCLICLNITSFLKLENFTPSIRNLWGLLKLDNGKFRIHLQHYVTNPDYGCNATSGLRIIGHGIDDGLYFPLTAERSDSP